MKDQILSQLGQSHELEKLYRKNKSEFKSSFNSLYPEIQGKGLADFWNARLNFGSDPVSWGNFRQWRFILIAAFLAWILAKLPAFFDWNEEFFYPRNLGFVVFPFVSAYFAWSQKLPIQRLAIPLLVVLASALYINLLPEDIHSDTLTLACIHLPLMLWGILGYVFSGTNGKELSKRLDYLNFNGDAVIMGAILGFAGLLMSGITVGLFGLIGINIEKFYFEYIAVFGLAAAPLLATHLTQTNPQLVNKVPPIIAKIFSPLVLVMLISYLGAIVYAGKDPYNDREFLLLFNLLLIGVMALIFFSVAESSEEKTSDMAKWVLTLLSIATIIVNLVALSAIGFRISEWGFTPNRLAVLGVNVLMLIHLVMVCRQLILSLRKNHSMEEVSLVVVRYLPIYLLWTVIVVFFFPVIFGFE